MTKVKSRALEIRIVTRRPPVLIRDQAPTEECRGRPWNRGERFHRVDHVLGDHALMGPVVAEVEHIYEHISGHQAIELGASLVEEVAGIFLIRDTNPRSVPQLKLMEVS